VKSKLPDKDKAKRAALAALRRARRRAEASGVPLSEWEGEFLGSVEGRLETFGKAFRDKEKGQAGDALSILQSVKLREIAAKAKGKEPKGLKRSAFKRRD
jgi:hypothetical protein